MVSLIKYIAQMGRLAPDQGHEAHRGVLPYNNVSLSPLYKYKEKNEVIGKCETMEYVLFYPNMHNLVSL